MEMTREELFDLAKAGLVGLAALLVAGQLWFPVMRGYALFVLWAADEAPPAGYNWLQEFAAFWQWLL